MRGLQLASTIRCHAILLALKVLCEVMSHLMNRIRNILSKNGITTRLLTNLEKLVSAFLCGRVPKTMEVCSRHRIDHFAPDFDANLAVLVENTFVELVLVDAEEAVVEGADISKASGET